jgi:phosphate transport system protein
MQADVYTARMVIENDKIINSFEIDLDNTIFNFLSLLQGDLTPELLRWIFSVQKVNPALERIGDHAANIADAVVMLGSGDTVHDLFGLAEMARECRSILHDAATGFLSGNPDLAKEVLQRDDSIDSRYRILISDVKKLLLADAPELTFDRGLLLIRIGKDLERIADLSMNIAEETIHAVEGDVVKHAVPMPVETSC